MTDTAPQPTAPALRVARMNYPGHEYVAFADLAARTGLTVDDAATRAIGLLLNERIYTSRPGAAVPDAAMIDASRALFPAIVAESPTENIRYSVGGDSWNWFFVAVTVDQAELAYLSSNARGEVDRTGWTLRTTVLEAAQLANRWLDRRQHSLGEGPQPAAFQGLGE